MKLRHDELIKTLKEHHLLVSDDIPLTLPAFKNRALIHIFSDGNKVVFLGTGKKLLFAFYPAKNNDIKIIREAHTMYVRLVNGDFSDFENGLIKIHKKIPKNYFANSENNIIFAS